MHATMSTRYTSLRTYPADAVSATGWCQTFSGVCPGFTSKLKVEDGTCVDLLPSYPLPLRSMNSERPGVFYGESHN